MQPHLWQPAVALSPEEAAIVRRIHRAKLFIFLREQRHTLFSPDFQAELAATLYDDKPKGHPPIPPAQLALATLLHASTGASDDEGTGGDDDGSALATRARLPGLHRTAV